MGMPFGKSLGYNSPVDTETDNLPAFADLIALADALESDPNKTRIVDVIRRAGRAQSCRSDLELAKHCCEAIAQFMSPSLVVTPVHLRTTRHALLMNAVLLYARATSTGKKRGERGSVTIEDRLPEELRDTHRHIVAIRDRVYAHVYSNEPIGDRVWHREVVYALCLGESWLPAAVTRRIQEDATALTDLRKLLPAADKLVRESFIRRINELAELLNQIPDLLPLLEDHRFDAVEFFGSAEEVRRVLASRRLGTAFGFIDD